MRRATFCFVFQTVVLLSSIHAEKKSTDNAGNVEDVEKVQGKISTSLKLADEDAKNRTSKVREVVASVSEHVCTGNTFE